MSMQDSTNQQNARHSTGPRTESGKQRSSLNALRHGLTGQTVVLPSEDLAAYQKFTRRFHDEFKPKGIVEEQLVQSLAETRWRLNRAGAIENNLLTLGAHQQAGSIDTEHPETRAALAMARQAASDQFRTLANISIYEQRLSRHFNKTLQQINEMQSNRRFKEQMELDRAADFLLLHQENKENKKNNIAYQPACDGFVCSNAEIEAYIHHRQRGCEASEAKYARRAAS